MNLIDPKQGGKAALPQQPRPARSASPAAHNDNRRRSPPPRRPGHVFSLTDPKA